MKILHTLLALAFVLISLHPLRAQEKTLDEKPMTISKALQEKDIRGQFEYLIKKSNRYQDFKVIKKVFIDKLKRNTIDTLKVFEDKVFQTNQQLAKQEEVIRDLRSSLAETNSSFEAVTQEKDNIKFIGMDFTKTSYKSLMWTIAGVLLGLLLFFIYKFKNSNSITSAAKKALSETEKEFEDHRTRALEREQKLNRKLQDELNKQRNKAGA